MRYFIGSPFFCLSILALLACWSHPAFAQTMLSQHGAWQVYKTQENGGHVCYMHAEPIKSEGNYRTRGNAYIQITQRPEENSYDVVSVIAGYTYKPKSQAELIVDGQSFKLFTDRDSAWGRDAAADKKITKAIRAGNRLRIKGRSSRNTLTIDTYSLKGSGEAYRAMNAACAVRTSG